MATMIILNVLSLLLIIISLIVFIIVLVRLFKEEGPLHGILGIICGFYPFIWGWIKHKQLKLTKVMVIWTVTIVLPVFLIVFFLGTGILMMLQGLKSMEKEFKSSAGIIQQPVRKPGAKPVPKTAKRPSRLLPDKKPASEGTADYESEMKKLNKLITQNEGNADAYYNRGWLYASKGDLQMAEKDYSKAIGINNRLGDAYYNRGLLMVKMKSYNQADKDFSEALRVNPRAVDAYCNRGNVNFQMGKMGIALEDFNAALKLSPNDADLYYNRAVVHLARKESSRAMADFKKAANMGHDKARKYLKMPPAKPQISKIPSTIPPGAWNLDLTNVKIPETTASGKIHGVRFTVEKANIENGILTIRQGKDFFPDYAVLIFLFLKKGEKLAGRTFNISKDKGFGVPHIHMKYKQEGKKFPKTEMFTKKYAMRLEFGKKENGFYPGKIYLSVPDELQSYVAGTFQAEAK